MIELVGNTGKLIDWSKIVDQLKNQQPSCIGPFYNTERLDLILESYKKANLFLEKDQGTVGWDIFLPGVNFDANIVKQFLEFVGIETYTDAWITRLKVGQMIPPFQEFNSEGSRWHCHISENLWGHVMFVDDIPLYQQQQGNVYRWSSKTVRYAANNVGFESQYFFNLY